MAELSDIEYIRSSVQFTSISDVAEINAYNKIKLDWKFDVYDTRDIISLTVMRVLLNPGEKADLSDPNIQKRFRTVLTWIREDDTAASTPPTTFTDEFKWDDYSDSGLHNLNYNNDLNWNYRKFRRVIQQICAGEQGIMYKIFGYSRRMNRAATPLGFFCDGNKIIALSQKNQMIKDHWYGECQEVWTTSVTEPGHGHFVRVAVDMTRDLSKQTGKERRVWASTTKGWIYCFDYWTGAIIGKLSINTDHPVYALSYSPTINKCVAGHSDTSGTNVYINLLSETSTGIETKLVTINGGCDNSRITGGICTTERTAGGLAVTPYFYMIFNKEMVMKYKLTATNATQFKRLARDHFGCTSVDFTDGVNKGLAVYANQNNIHGIGAGINGQVWATGHTPVTVVSHILEERPDGHINVRIRVGRSSNGNRGCKVVTKPHSANGVCKKDIAAKFQSAASGVWIEDLLRQCPGLVNKHWGSAPDDWSDDSNHWVQAAWNYSAEMGGSSRDAKRGKRDRYHGGCAVGLNSNDGVRFLEWCRTHGKLQDNRWPESSSPYATGGTGQGQAITRSTLQHLPAGGPDNDDDNIIWLIHQQPLEITTDTHWVDILIQRPIMQDLNYVYGCNENENVFDTNGQLEDNNNALVYRKAISAKPAEYPSKFFKTTTNWCSAEYAMHQYGFAGRPYVFDWDSTGADAPYSHTSNEIESVDKQVGKPHIPSYGYDTQVFHKIPGNKTVIGVNKRKELFTDGVNSGTVGLFRTISGHGDELYCDVLNFAAEISGKQDEALPMSLGTLYARMPNDGRMYVDRVYADAYFTAKDKTANGFSYELLFADRREGKIGFLKYKRPRTSTTADISYIPSGENRRLKYENNSDYEYYMDRGLGNQLEFLDRAPYHVVVDSDNNIWTCSPRGISKIQLLTSAHGLDDKYVYDRASRSGLMLYETENTLKEVCLYYLNKHAKFGAKYKNLYRENGIENKEGPSSNSDYASAWKAGHELMVSNGVFALESSDSDNLAYHYNYKEWQKARGAPNGCWETGKIFSGDHFVWKRAYTRDDATFNLLSHKDGSGPNEVSKQKMWMGNQNNEYNDDNFGMNCLVQLNKVELGPDITYPVINDPNAKSKITRSVSRSNNDICDTQDGSAFWDSKTLIFNNEQSTSGYDDLDTTHFIYDIEQNYRHLLRHRYNYNDFSKYNLEGYFDVYNHEPGATQPAMMTIIRDHDFEYEEDTYDLTGLENVLDNWPTGVWHTPNYWGLVPPYSRLAELRADHFTARPLYVDLFIDYTPSVYNVYDNAAEETIQVGHHEIHVFERWPTGGFCLRGRGGDTMTDAKTGINKLGAAYWGDCINDANSGNCYESANTEVIQSSVKKPKKRKTTKRKKQ